MRGSLPVNTGSSDGALIGAPGEARKSEILHGVWTQRIQRAGRLHGKPLLGQYFLEVGLVPGGE